MGEAAAAAAVVPAGRKRSRAWCFTVNNPTPSERLGFPDGLPNSISYFVFQVERGEAEQTEHLQGFVYFANPISMNAIKAITRQTAEGGTVKFFERAHLEPAHNVSASIAYCKKEESRVALGQELGQAPVGKGHRTDLDVAVKTILTNGSVRSVEPDVMVKYMGNLLKIASYAPCLMRPDLQVFTLIGPTGIGKSFSVHELYPNLYSPFYGNCGFWFDGYDGEQVILIDEFRGQVPLQRMLQILDIYPLRVECKGTSLPARFRMIFLTSNTQPDDWYPDVPGKVTRQAERDALSRRLGTRTSRFINASSRGELHSLLALALPSPTIPYQPVPWLPAPAAAPAAAADVAPAAAVDAAPTAVVVPASTLFGPALDDDLVAPDQLVPPVATPVLISDSSDEESPPLVRPLKRTNAILN